MKKYSLVKKGAALAVAAAVTLSAGNVVLAGSRSGSFKIQQGNYVTVLKSTPIEKAGKKIHLPCLLVSIELELMIRLIL